MRKVFKGMMGSRINQKAEMLHPASLTIYSVTRRFIPGGLLFSRARFRFNLHGKCKV